jgi:biopolymer transport protein ExbD
MAFSITGTAGNGSSGGSGLSSEINITPLIDVLLVLLIIFMVIVPVAPRGLHSALPAVDSVGADTTTDRPVLVQVEQGQTGVQYVVEGISLERGELAPRLLELMSQRSVRQMLLRGDARLDFGVIAGVLDAGRTAGAESVGLLTPKACLPSR